jgi:enoyl-CoA hydratase
MELDYILYEVLDNVAVITLNRPDKANAQNYQLLHELNDCWNLAAADDGVRVILLNANGKHFSAGHDMAFTGGDPRTVSSLQDGKWDMARLYRNEQKVYLEYCLNWRNIPKPSIAAVQGKCIAGGLMLCWPCDLILAADDAEFSDPVIWLGIGGVEYHGHTWELGGRKAKEMLFTGRSMSASEAERVGMVNRVEPLDELQTKALELAHEIATKDPFGLLQAKRAVNQTLDVQGFQTALQSVFDIHHLGHGVAHSRSGNVVLAGLEELKRTGDR